MKNFKFNLEPLLRLKEVEKKKIELELAHCQLEIDDFQHKLDSENKSISDMLSEAELLVRQSGSIRSLLSIPNIMEIKKKNIKTLEDNIKTSEEKRQEVLKRLNIKNSEIKNINEKRDEKYNLYKKQIEKIEDDKRSELYNLVAHYKKLEH